MIDDNEISKRNQEHDQLSPNVRRRKRSNTIDVVALLEFRSTVSFGFANFKVCL